MIGYGSMAFSSQSKGPEKHKSKEGTEQHKKKETWDMGLSKNPDINQMVFPRPRVIVFFLLSFFQVLASHPHETIHIVFSLWDITLQPPASHLFFGEQFASAKLAASNMSHKQYIMYNVYV